MRFLFEILGRWGGAVELDLLHTTHLTFQDFGPPGSHPWATLYNLVSSFQARSTSHLAAAMATDVELYESMLDKDGNPPKARNQAPPLTEVGLSESLLMTIQETLQTIAHYTAQATGKPKVTYLPRPQTASAEYRRRLEKAAELDLLRMVGEA